MLLIASERFEEHVTPPGHPERMERARVHGPRRPVGQSRRRSGSSRGRQPVRSRPESTTTPTSTTSLRSRAGQSASTQCIRRPNRKSRRLAAGRAVQCRRARADARRDRVRAGAAAASAMRSVIGQWVSASTTRRGSRRRGSGKRHRTCRDRGHRRHHGNGSMFYDDPACSTCRATSSPSIRGRGPRMKPALARARATP